MATLVAMQAIPMMIADTFILVKAEVFLEIELLANRKASGRMQTAMNEHIIQANLEHHPTNLS